MDAVQLILINTFNPSKDLRDEAENKLKEYLKFPGALSNFLNFTGNPSTNIDLRKAASIVVKNNTREFWKENLCSDAEKENIKNVLMQILLKETDNSIRGILAESIRNIAEFDFPTKYSNSFFLN